jgi:transcriptional regulator with XRE-family HTH domain
MARALERGRQNVSVVVLDRLAKVLRIEAWELLQPQEGLETKKAP